MIIPCNSYFRSAVLMSAVLALAACDSKTKRPPVVQPGPGPTPSLEAKSTGVVSKGILRHAPVEAFELNAQGERVRSLGTSRTDANGRYNLNLGGVYEGGPLLLTVTADGDTRMVCDVPDSMGGCAETAFGDELALDDDFELLAVVPSIANDSEVKAQLTPFTTMAAHRALAETVSDQSIQRANSATSQILGVNILTTEPVDLASGAAAPNSGSTVYAAYLAGLGGMAYAREDGLSHFIHELAASFADGAFDADDSVRIDDLLSNVRQASTALFPNLPGLLNHSLTVLEANIDEDGGYSPEPTELADASAVEKAKAVLTRARTLFTSVSSLEQPLEAFAVDTEAAAAVLNQEAVVLMELVASVLDVVITEGGEFELGEHVLTLQNGAGATVGSLQATLAESEGGTSLALQSADLPGGVTLALNLAFNLPFSDLQSEEPVALQALAVTLSGSVESSKAKLVLEEMSLQAGLLEAVSFNFARGEWQKEPIVSSGTLAGELSLTAKGSGASFTGRAALELVGLDEAARRSPDNSFSIKRVALDGGFSHPASGAFTAAIALDIDNASGFDTFAYLDHEPVVYLSGETELPEAMAEALASFGYTDVYGFNYDGERTEIHSYSHLEQIFFGDRLNTRAYVESLVRAENEWLDSAFAGLHDLWFHHDTGLGGPQQTRYWATVALADFEQADYYARGSLSLTLDLELSGHPATRAVLTVGRSGLEGGNALLTFLHGGSQWSMGVEKADGEEIWAIQLTDPDGVVLSLSEGAGDVLGKITVDDRPVATVNTARNGLVLVRWADGTMESLF